MPTYGLGHWYIELEKQGFWRGKVHTWVNRYVMSGPDPTSSVAVNIMGQIKNAEDHIYPSRTAGVGVGFVIAKAYLSTGHAPFATVPYNTSLNAASATGFSGPATAYTSLTWSNQLEACLDVRALLPNLSISGKPVYLRKYYRGFLHTQAEDGGVTPIAAADITEINSNLGLLTNGGLPNGITVIGLAQAVTPSAFTAQTFTGNHQIPRGKKKKKVTLTTAQVEAALNP